MIFKMAATEHVFFYNFGSSRVRYSNQVSIPPEIDIPDTPDPSILRVDVVLQDKSNIVERRKTIRRNVRLKSAATYWI